MCFAAIVILYLGFSDSNKAVVSPATPALLMSGCSADDFGLIIPNDHNILIRHPNGTHDHSVLNSKADDGAWLECSPGFR